jgi:Glycosyl transferase family 2
LSRRLAGGLARAAAAGAVAATAHTLVNLRQLRVPPSDPELVTERVSVLLPLRNEAARVGACLTALLAQEGLPDLEILVLDDGSDDDTASVVHALAAADQRVRFLTGRPLPPGWIGKPHACAQLADAASGAVLVFVDADVVLAPDAVARTVALMREAGLDLVCPYPRQVARTAGERLVQPLLQWSWLTFLPLQLAERSPSPSLAAANGQLLACDRAAYARVGGHGAVRGAVLEDLALARTFKAGGCRAGMADGTTLASCRMYESWRDLEAGYTKSLWSAFGTPGGAVAVLTLLSALYVVPPVAAVLGRGDVRRAGLVGTAAGLAGRVVVARRVGGRVWPDSAAHPVSVVLLGWLTARSVAGRRRGELTWKGRTL